jgi:peptidoglycan/LPS O-acetylase OafA/YrhL
LTSQTVSESTASYRPDVDGLRAVAILSVILFHLRTGLLPGGFVGVDIFFVISGFLITRNICREIAAGKFSVREFYRRRVKRIAPAMLAVVLVTLIAAELLMLPADALATARSAVFSLLSMANVYFWHFQDSGYFATDTAHAPLLHLWSLGVEEQFYIAWPLLLMAFYRVSRVRIFMLAMAAAAIGSFHLGQTIFSRNPSFDYYMLPTRAGELLLGALVAVASLHHVERRVPAWLVAPMAVVGAVLLLLTLLFLSETYPFPGWLALPPTLGTSALILSGLCGPSFVSRALSVSPMVWLGKISYSAYLWHWPILALYTYGYGAVGNAAATVIFVLTIGLAWISYRFVEQPARRSRAPARNVFAYQYAVPAGALVSLSLCLIYPSRLGIAVRSPDYLARLQVMQEQTHPAYRFDWVCQRYKVEPDDATDAHCVLGSGGAATTAAVLWGDSNASQYIKMLESFARAGGFRFRNIEVNSCPPVDVDPKPFVTLKSEQDCRASLEMLRSVVPQYQVVMVAASWTSYQRQSATFLPVFFDGVRRLAQMGKLVILIGKVPEIGGYDSLCRQKALSYPLLTCPNISVPVAKDVRNINAQLRRFAATTPGVRYFDATNYICPANRCSALGPDGAPQYYDHMHLTVAASTRLGRTILSREGVPAPFSEIAAWARTYAP